MSATKVERSIEDFIELFGDNVDLLQNVRNSIVPLIKFSENSRDSVCYHFFAYRYATNFYDSLLKPKDDACSDKERKALKSITFHKLMKEGVITENLRNLKQKIDDRLLKIPSHSL